VDSDQGSTPDDDDLDSLATEMASAFAARHVDRKDEIARAIAEAKSRGITRGYIPIGSSRVASPEESEQFGERWTPIMREAVRTLRDKKQSEGLTAREESQLEVAEASLDRPTSDPTD
jgi:hypothetical protein